MAEFKKLSEVEALSEVPENATVLAEVDGSIKRIPSKGLGSNSTNNDSIKTAIIKDSEYDNTLAGLSTAVAIETTYECLNMTFEEAYQIMASGEPLSVFGMFSIEGAVNLYGSTAFAGTLLGTPCIFVTFFYMGSEQVAALYWTADGLSVDPPSDDK